MGTILGKGFDKHKCIQITAQVPKAQMLSVIRGVGVYFLPHFSLRFVLYGTWDVLLWAALEAAAASFVFLGFLDWILQY